MQSSAPASVIATLIEAVQSLAPSVESQVVATVGVVVALLAYIALVDRLGTLVKQRLDDHALAVESVQAAAVTTGAVTAAAFVLVVWRGVGTLTRALPTEVVTGATVVQVLLSVGIIVGATLLTRLTKRTIRNVGHDQVALSDHQTEIAHHIVQVAVYAVSLLVVFTVWGINPGNLLVGAGFAGIVLGLAARQTLGAVLAGFVVLFSRPFELGDWVVIGDQEGVVTDITIVNTQIRTFDDEYVMIPNDIVTNQDLVNRSRKGRLRLNLDVGVDYTTDVDEAIEVAEEAMRGHDLVMSAPDPHVVLTGFDDSSIGLRLRFYIDNPSARKMWKARTRVTLAVKRAFDDAGVKIPYPQRELSGRAETGSFRVADAEDGRTERQSVTAEADGGQTDGSSADDGGDDA